MWSRTCSRWRCCGRRRGEARLTEITAQGQYVRFGQVTLRDSALVRLQRLYPKSIVKQAAHTVLVPRPRSSQVGGPQVRDEAVLVWASQVVDDVLLPASQPVQQPS